MKAYKKFGHFLIISLLFLWILFTDSHFQKSGVKTEFYFVIAAFVTLISLLISLWYDNIKLIEKIIISIAFAFLSLFIMTTIIGPMTLEIFYQDKTWFLWETKHRIIINTFFYGSNTVILIGLFLAYSRVRQIKITNF